MAAYDQGPLAKYNSLTDRHLMPYFSNDRMRRHLLKSGLITKDGEVVSDAVYRIRIARREHRRRVRDLIAQAIIHKALEMERSRQIDIRKKIEEISKIELVRRVRTDRARIGDEEFVAYFNKGNMEVKTRSARAKTRSLQSQSDMDESKLPATPDQESRHRLKKLLPNEEIETKHLAQLDSLTLGEYAKILEKQDRNRINRLPYLGLGNENIHSKPKTLQLTKTSKNKNYPELQKNKKKENDNLILSQLAHLSKSQAHTVLSLLFHAPSNNRSFEVLVEQQPSGSNTIILHKESITNNTIFQVISHRHKGFPFSLSFFIDNVKDSRISTCCEYKHKVGKRIGGPTGHFTLFAVEGDNPCFRCLAERDLAKEKQSSKDHKSAEHDDSKHENVSARSTSEDRFKSGNEFESGDDLSNEVTDEEEEEEIHQSHSASRLDHQENKSAVEISGEDGFQDDARFASSNNNAVEPNMRDEDANEIALSSDQASTNPPDPTLEESKSNHDQADDPPTDGLDVNVKHSGYLEDVIHHEDEDSNRNGVKHTDSDESTSNVHALRNRNENGGSPDAHLREEIKMPETVDPKVEPYISRDEESFDYSPYSKPLGLGEAASSSYYESDSDLSGHSTAPEVDIYHNSDGQIPQVDFKRNEVVTGRVTIENTDDTESQTIKTPFVPMELKSEKPMESPGPDHDGRVGTIEQIEQNDPYPVEKNTGSANIQFAHEHKEPTLIGEKEPLPIETLHENKLMMDINDKDLEKRDVIVEIPRSHLNDAAEIPVTTGNIHSDQEMAGSVVDPLSDTESVKSSSDNYYSSTDTNSQMGMRGGVIICTPLLSHKNNESLKIIIPKDEEDDASLDMHESGFEEPRRGVSSPSFSKSLGNDNKDVEHLSNVTTHVEPEQIEPETSTFVRPPSSMISSTFSISESELATEADNQVKDELQEAVHEDQPSQDLSKEVNVVFENDDITFKKAKDTFEAVTGERINSLAIRNCELPSYIFNFIANKLEAQKTLKKIELTGCEVEISLLKFLAKFLEKWPMLETLIISNNVFVDYSLFDLVNIIEYLYRSNGDENTPPLKMLDVTNCALQENDFCHIIKMISDNTRVDNIVLDQNHIDSKLWQDLLAALKKNSTTKSVSIKGCVTDASLLEDLDNDDLREVRARLIID